MSEALPPVTQKGSTHPGFTQASGFGAKVDHYNKIAKLGEYSLLIGAHILGAESKTLSEVVEFSKTSRQFLLPSRAVSKLSQSTMEGVPCELGTWSNGSYRVTMFLLFALYSLNFVEFTSRRGWFLSGLTSQLQEARSWTAFIVGPAGVFSGTLGSYQAFVQKKQANEAASALSITPELKSKWEQRSKLVGTALWVNLFATSQAGSEWFQNVLPGWGYQSRGLFLGLGFVGASSSFAKGWVATEAPPLRRS
jgi:hypothetical protein